jgi:MFS family permease
MKKQSFQLYRGLPKEIYLLFAARIVNTVGSFVMPLIALILTDKIGMTLADAGSFSTLVCLTQVPCVILGGKLIDKIGRKPMILLFNTLGALFYMACAFTGTTRLTAVLILIACDCYVFAWPAFDAITADVTTGEARKRAFSLLYLGVNLGYAVGPVLGGLLFENHLPLLFFIDGLTTLLSTTLIFFLPETKNRALPAEANGTEEDGITETSNTLHVLRQVPVLTLFLFITLFYSFTYVQYGFTLPLQMDAFFQSHGPRLYSTLVTVNAVVVIVLTPLVTRLSVRFRALRAVAFGGLLFCLSFLLFAVSRGMAAFYAAIVLFTLGEIVTTISTGVFIADSTPPTHRGRINSVANLIRGAGNALGPIVMGHVLEQTNYFSAWMIIAGLMGLGFLFMLVLDLSAKRETKVY